MGPCCHELREPGGLHSGLFLNVTSIPYDGYLVREQLPRHGQAGLPVHRGELELSMRQSLR